MRQSVEKSVGLLVISILLSSSAVAQEATNILDDRRLVDVFRARWISHPEISLKDHNVVLFRKGLELAEKPTEFVIHVSADNRYRLFVNGTFVCSGPARSDLAHWYYETVDLAPFLKAGPNSIAAEVVHFGPDRGFSQFSHLTAFFLQGHGKDEQVLDTGPDNGWKTFHNRAYRPRPVEWMDRKDVAFGFYAGHPTDIFDAALHPWGWEQRDYDDALWREAVWIDLAGGRNTQHAGGILYPGGWMLVPRPHQLLDERPEYLGSIVRENGLNPQKGFLAGTNPLTVAPHSTVSLLMDNQALTVGFPEIEVSGGRGSQIDAIYAEALYEEDGRSKGNRNETEGKKVIGIRDVFLPDGGANRIFRPLWLRSFRFVQLEITTAGDSLTIHRYLNRASSYPLELKAVFRSDDPKLDRLMEPGWRTAAVCAQDILMSDAYYEQMQYVGDSKVHNLGILMMTGDDALVRNALQQFDWSRFPDGLTLACYPNAFHLVIPYYSLLWIDMVYDTMMWSGDREFIAGFELGIRDVLFWFEQRLQQNNLLGPMEWWADVDWSPGFPNGVPPGAKQGNSALFSLQFAKSLDHGAQVLEWLGRDEDASRYRATAARIKNAARTLCWDPGLGLFAETPIHASYSQHTNLLAVLTGTVEGEQARELMIRVVRDKSLSQVALFFRYFLLEALAKVGLEDEMLAEFQPWQDMMDMGLTTFTEIPVDWKDQRSDCHPWSVSPNIHFFTSIAGIRPASPGYETVVVRPAFGTLTRIEAVFPHPKGSFALDLNKAEGRIQGFVSLPSGSQGVFLHHDIQLPLKPGKNRIDTHGQ